MWPQANNLATCKQGVHARAGERESKLQCDLIPGRGHVEPHERIRADVHHTNVPGLPDPLGPRDRMCGVRVGLVRVLDARGGGGRGDDLGSRV